ncbi:hypothetical protein CASFOL_019768 [Castilleja foliolosa]|uniref:PB1 domain-containing protein n=1 Tax=Castilleja foliolosa TaxID=1961234 RepID=A0ABD3D0Z7_9LAMI
MSTDSIPVSTGSAPSFVPGSPKIRLKFLCSHGGKILLRPSDGHLKYVGGETRVMSVPRDITFQELMKKLTHKIEGEMALKYQVMSEDLDALVSVKSDEDLRHMLDEIDRYENTGSPRLRAFLFPDKPSSNEQPNGACGPPCPRAMLHRRCQRHNPLYPKIHNYTQPSTLCSTARASHRPARPPGPPIAALPKL